MEITRLYHLATTNLGGMESVEKDEFNCYWDLFCDIFWSLKIATWRGAWDASLYVRKRQAPPCSDTLVD